MQPSSPIIAALGGSPAEQTRGNAHGSRASASSIAIIERIAVGIVKKFATRWRERTGVAGFPGERWRRLRP